jgi:N-acetylglucosaminyldiphosphoundecaprenol N-acetyl-beta-D-mannosaminyltransferase
MSLLFDRKNFIGFPVDNVDLNEVISFVESTVENNLKSCIAVQNANKMYLSSKYSRMKKFIDDASLILPENAINLGMRFLGSPLKQRNMGGIHIMEELLKLADKKNYSVYFIGSSDECLEKLIKVLKEKYTSIVFKGFKNGFFNEDKISDITGELSSERPNILFIGMGSPKQEFFIQDNFDNLNSNIVMGVGGSFNVLAGLEKPAPAWTKYGFEWLYRSISDPKKFRRYLVVNNYYIYCLVKYMLTRKKIL